ncbi:Terpenoid cylases/protein prenyltransferase alpha-alpha toroid [Apiospora kogelbergensis]|uniref:Protein farnesyltransferase subunit beta n=2 Tax=Apiospora kogelbergensis TaxID=1337665 RepID=A0AAW0R1E7_9PEZI
MATTDNRTTDNLVDEEVVSQMADYSTRGSRLPIDVLYTSEPPIVDPLVTTTSKAQDQTIDQCLPLLRAADSNLEYNANGVPRLHRERHIKYLETTLGNLPAAFVGADASRPWCMYWALNALSLLGADVSKFRENLIATAAHMQNKTGGFGGGFGQTSHLATTYATVLSLVIVGGESAYEVIDRRAMWKWLSSLKQPNGGFQMSLGGEVDVRGAYCAAVIISLLNIPLSLSSDSPASAAGLDDLYTGLASYVQRCQTFEGGISAKPDAEAHGAYAFCALGCLSILDAPHRIIPRTLNVPRLISWLSSRQYAPEGGFSGRTNKLVDGCYSHWVGACWPLIQASLGTPSKPAQNSGPQSESTPEFVSFYDREGLIRYIMTCGQDHSSKGGMRDKPSHRSDAYHTCYVLSGLTSAQHVVSAVLAEDEYVANTTWKVSPYSDPQLFDEQDRLNPTDPVYAIPQKKREEVMTYFLSKPGF